MRSQRPFTTLNPIRLKIFNEISFTTISCIANFLEDNFNYERPQGPSFCCPLQFSKTNLDCHKWFHLQSSRQISQRRSTSFRSSLPPAMSSKQAQTMRAFPSIEATSGFLPRTALAFSAGNNLTSASSPGNSKLHIVLLKGNVHIACDFLTKQIPK